MRICGIVVLFNPDKSIIEKIKTYNSQLEKLFVIDNSNFDNSKLVYGISNVEYLGNYSNKGIAVAQNIGINRAAEEGFEYILFSDQDSQYPENYIERMFEEIEKLPQTFASIAPTFYDSNSKSYSGFKILGKKSILSANYKNGIHEVIYSISSGQIIPTEMFKHIGLFKENYFIDWVDIEWCLRANAKGYKNYQTADICINHVLGYRSKRFLKYSLTIHNKVRRYYYLRNGFYMIFHEKLQKNIKIAVLYMLLKNFIVYIISQPVLLFHNIILLNRAIFCAFLSKMGKADL